MTMIISAFKKVDSFDGIYLSKIHADSCPIVVR